MDARLLEANRLLQQRQPQLAEIVCRQVLADRPGDAQALAMLGAMQHKRGDWAGALASFEAAQQSQPDSAVLLNLQALTLQKLGRFGDAEAAWRKALALQPQSSETLMNLGVALHHQLRFQDALETLDLALALRPGSLEIQLNRANALMELDRWDEAMAALEPVRAAHPRDVPLLMNVGNALRDQHRFDEAMAVYGEALDLSPQDPGVRWNRSLCLLASGDFARGWPEYEWRFAAGELGNAARKVGAPRWSGREDLRGKTLLLHAEQGLGDSIQMSRYGRVLAALGARVVMQVQKPVQALLEHAAGFERVISMADDPGPVDFHCPMLSLPLALGTLRGTIPSPLGSVAADPVRVEQWRDVVPANDALNVGLVWAGNPGYAGDHRRSLPLERFRAALPAGPRYWCLQKDVASRDEPHFGGASPVSRFERNEFPHTAAQIACMDLVVGVDTSVTHLAATLGATTWFLLPFTSDFRWATDAEVSPWYPGARIFRQQQPGDWAPVLAQVRQALAEFRPR